jgi:ATP-binding cassette subfamily C (CFTR/MRP) protein 4
MICCIIEKICVLVLASKKISSTRQFVAATTDSRIRLLSNIINGINAIKMFTWEKPFAALVDQARKFVIFILYNSYTDILLLKERNRKNRNSKFLSHFQLLR